jgi:hypothetical protein
VEAAGALYRMFNSVSLTIEVIETRIVRETGA